MAQRQRSHTEEESLAELATTQVSPLTARVLTWGFVVLVVAVPLGQLAYEGTRGQSPQVLAVLAPLRGGLSRLADGGWREAARACQPLLTASFLRSYEERLEKTSLAHRLVQPRVQAWLSRLGQFGNEKCLVGRKGWLFYQPGVDYVTGPDFLDEDHLAAQQRKQAQKGCLGDAQPDPRPAIVRMHEDCRRAGVHLVVVPVPDKAMLQPLQLSRRAGRAARQGVPNNPGFAQLVGQLRAQGVDVFDPTPAALAGQQELYLKQDSHWLPSFMEQTAERLAEHVQQVVALPPVDNSRVGLLEKVVASPGDLVAMLKLPRSQTDFRPEQVAIRQVVDLAKGVLWSPDAQADVLLLGDSFTNIYSDGEGSEGLGWGRSAGFAAHLSYHLGRPVDVIARNGSGAAQVRAELARRPDPLGGKRVIVWQFAMRDLAQADWKEIPLSGHNARPAEVAAGRLSNTDALTIEGTLLAVSQVPQPYAVPYKDCLTYVKVRVERVEAGRFNGDCLIAAFWGLRNNVLQPAAHYRPGERFRLGLISQQQASRQLVGVRVADDLNDFEHPTYYVQEVSRP